jgi:hypothetical protein
VAVRVLSVILVVALAGVVGWAVLSPGGADRERAPVGRDAAEVAGTGLGAGSRVGESMGSAQEQVPDAASGDYPTPLLVEAPRGPLGPQTSVAIDPATVDGIRFNGERWIVEADVTFDEQVAGGYLDFDAPVLVVGPGVSIDGARFAHVDVGRGHVLSGERPEDGFVARHFTVEGGAGASAVGGLGENVTLESFSIVDFDGDGLKPASGWVVSDGSIHLLADNSSAKHYDGVQVTGHSGVTLSRLEISMVGAGTAAVFVHESPFGGDPNLVHDIVVTHAPDVYRTFRFDESVVAHDLQAMGPVGSSHRPSALVLANARADIDWATLHSTFDSPVPLN